MPKRKPGRARTSQGASAPALSAQKVTHIRDLTPDPKNARKHNPKNIGMISDSLRAVGAGRSIVLDEDNVILAGNGLVEAAAEAGITKVQIVDADGETIIAVRRTGLTPDQKTKLALYDNRAAEIAEWDLDVLKSFAADGLDLAPYEFNATMLNAESVAAEPTLKEQWMIVLTCRDETQQRDLLDRFLSEGLTCRAVAS